MATGVDMLSAAVRKGLFVGAIIALVSSLNPGLPEWASLGIILPSADWAGGIAFQRQVVSRVASVLDELLVPPVHAATLPVPPRTYQLRKGTYLGKFRVTFYWLVEEADYEGKKTCPLYTAEGELIGHFTPQFIQDFRTESCALLRDGRIISYLKKADRCKVVDTPIGTGGYTLTELKSIAVDPALISIGSTVYIPDMDDVPIGNNTYHNGIFRAHDVGSAIKNHHIDVYLGLKSNMEYLRSTSLCRRGEVDVYLLQ